jgi:hypothetical protein
MSTPIKLSSFFQNPVKLISKIILSVLIGFLLAFGFDALFLGLSGRPMMDQALLLFFPAAAFGYLAFSVLENSQNFFHTRVKISFHLSDFPSFIREHLAGLIVALLFFLVYFYIGLRLNPAHVDTVDNYLDADNSSWMHRIADPDGSQLEMRGPHPFAYLVFRPFGLFLNFFTADFALSAILLNTFAGALCVFFGWLYFKRQTLNSVYALIMACLLGLGTSQFFFSSVVETYIFSALFLIVFFVLLQRTETSDGNLVMVALITFGITLTNFVQSFIGFFVSRPRVKEVIRFAGLTLSFGILLGMVQAARYPSSTLFFLPSGARAEEEFAFSVFTEPSWRVIGRLILLVRTVLLYAVVAPKPYVFTTEVGGTFPRFNFFKISPEIFSYSSYSGLGNVLILVWAAFLFAAGVLFVLDILRTRKIDIRLGLALCVLFNFVLHYFYGYEPFLYSADWAYALIFFVGLSLSSFADNKILQLGMFAFLLGLAVNQWHFFGFIFEAIAPFVK